MKNNEKIVRFYLGSRRETCDVIDINIDDIDIDSYLININKLETIIRIKNFVPKKYITLFNEDLFARLLGDISCIELYECFNDNGPYNLYSLVSRRFIYWLENEYTDSYEMGDINVGEEDAILTDDNVLQIKIVENYRILCRNFTLSEWYKAFKLFFKKNR